LAEPEEQNSTFSPETEQAVVPLLRIKLTQAWASLTGMWRLRLLHVRGYRLSKGVAKTAVEIARRVRRVVALEKIILTVES
jgi:hypothetical protein